MKANNRVRIFILPISRMDSRLLHFEIHLKFTFRDETGTIPLCENAGEISILTVCARVFTC